MLFQVSYFHSQYRHMQCVLIHSIIPQNTVHFLIDVVSQLLDISANNLWPLQVRATMGIFMATLIKPE